MQVGKDEMKLARVGRTVDKVFSIHEQTLVTGIQMDGFGPRPRESSVLTWIGLTLVTGTQDGRFHQEPYQRVMM